MNPGLRVADAPFSDTTPVLPETALNAVIRDLSRRIFDGQRPRLGAPLPQRLAGDPDFGLGFFRDADIASGGNLHDSREKIEACPVGCVHPK